MNLPKLYQRVVEKRPEAAVQDGVFHVLMHDEGDERWRIAPTFGSREGGAMVTEPIAAALIFAHWCGMLPTHARLTRAIDNPGPRWYIDATATSMGCVFPCCDTPIEALAAWLIESTRPATTHPGDRRCVCDKPMGGKKTGYCGNCQGVVHGRS